MFVNNTCAVIAAVDSKGGFAKDKKMPWHYPEDSKFFKKMTYGNICVMGRSTYEELSLFPNSIESTVLPNRTCFVVSKSPYFKVTETSNNMPNAIHVRSINDIGKNLKPDDKRSIFFIGGHGIFVEGLALSQTAYITLVNKDYQCDKFFPVSQLLSNFNKVISSPGKSEDLTFVTYHRK